MKKLGELILLSNLFSAKRKAFRRLSRKRIAYATARSRLENFMSLWEKRYVRNLTCDVADVKALEKNPAFIKLKDELQHAWDALRLEDPSLEKPQEGDAVKSLNEQFAAPSPALCN